ncbi:dynamin family protein [Pseudomonas capeferrum]
MNIIEITHNPFTVETQFVINGQAPAHGCKLSSYKELRLQVWVEKLFDELSRLFNGDNNFQIVFTGVESDYLDIVEAADTAFASGMQVHLTFNQAQPTEERLDQIRALMLEAREHPQFEAYIHDNQEAHASFEEAFDRDFDVYVVATMSSGKSTLINAMLGRDLLPAANEATTATIARITDNDSMKDRFSARRLDAKRQPLDSSADIDLATLEQWNRQEDTYRIDIEGDIQAIQERESVRLVLTDTPGPNNSQDEEHERTTMGFISDSKRNPLILYVLNASQLATNDDRNLLSLVAQAMREGGKQSKDRFIFVINKMDVFDPEKGEEVPKVLDRVQAYLEANGIPNPLIYPVSANLTRLLRKPAALHSRRERDDLNTMGNLFSEEPSMNLLQYMPITSRVKRALKEKHYAPLLLASGLPAVEAMIDEYIDKYNLPHRLKRAYDAMNKAISVGLNEANLIEQLDQDEHALGHINEEIQALQYRREKGFDTAAFKDKIEREGKVLPRETEDALVTLDVENRKFIKEVAAEFVGKVVLSKAKIKVDEADMQLKFNFNKLLNSYESVFLDSQKSISEELNAEYKKYVIELFEDSRHLQLPVLDGLRTSVADISVKLNLQQQDVKTREVVVGSHQVSASTWYNPFSWGDTRTVYEYASEEYVDLAEIWADRHTRVTSEFQRLVISAREHIEGGKDLLIEQFLGFMNREFVEKFDGILNAIQHKLDDRGAREQAIEDAREMKNWIDAFKAKLDKTLSV